ncbi:MAG: UMP kinase [Deltaproteobacteria bacterium]|nr:UMP kinase [Deltaproteobacteria bacterium]
MDTNKPRFRRILLKLSGEALMGDKSFGIDPVVLKTVAKEVHKVHEVGVDVAIVIGGGNIFRGLNSTEYGMRRVPADHIGMLATVINAIALGEALNNIGSETRVMSAIDMNKVAEPYIRGRAVGHLNRNRIVLFGAGTGNPYFSTDTAAALRAMEINAEALLKATKVDGVFDSDPEKNPSSIPFARLTYREVLKRNLQVMDMTAVSLAMGENLPIHVFNLRKKDNIKKIIFGQNVGTLISEEEKG